MIARDVAAPVEGQHVLARWTWNFTNYQALARIDKINTKTVRVELLQDAGDHFKVGFKVGPIPRVGTTHNGIFPREEAREMHKSSPEDTIEVPHKLSYVPGRPPGDNFAPGRGEAGWQTVHVPRSASASFLRRLPPAAWMPGTVRLAQQHGLPAPPMGTVREMREVPRNQKTDELSDAGIRALAAVNFFWATTQSEDRAIREELIPGGYVDTHGNWRLTPKGVTALRAAMDRSKHSWIKIHGPARASEMRESDELIPGDAVQFRWDPGKAPLDSLRRVHPKHVERVQRSVRESSIGYPSRLQKPFYAIPRGTRVRVRTKNPAGRPLEAFWMTLDQDMTHEQIARQTAQTAQPGMIVEVSSGDEKLVYRVTSGQSTGSRTPDVVLIQ